MKYRRFPMRFQLCSVACAIRSISGTLECGLKLAHGICSFDMLVLLGTRDGVD